MTTDTQEMLHAIAQHGSEPAKAKATAILKELTTIEEEIKYTGSFMTAVLKGDFLSALRCADRENKQALLNLIKKRYELFKD